MRIYIGYDSREAKAFEVARKTATAFGHEVIPLHDDRLRAAGLLTRPVDNRNGQMYDIASGAPQSTEFAASRFLVPLLAQAGWVLFCDSDVVFLEDPAQLLETADPQFAVMVVQHVLPPTVGMKMDRQIQTSYRRKLWSSVMLINADHPANRRLNLQAVNGLPGRDLHALCWLHDSEIGELEPRWNWLVGLQPKPGHPAIAHFTLGGGWLPGWGKAEHDDIWWRAAG